MRILLVILLFSVVLIAVSCNSTQFISSTGDSFVSGNSIIPDKPSPIIPASTASSTSKSNTKSIHTIENEPIEETVDLTCVSGYKEIHKTIEKGGSEYTFGFSYDLNYDGAANSSVNASVYLNIFDKDKEIKQIIEFESWNNWGVDAFTQINLSEWIVKDINFDGYQDIICLRSVGGAKSNYYYIGWLWNPFTSTFESANIDDICNLSIHEEDQSLRSVSAESAGHHRYQIYRYIDDRFVLTNQLDFGPDTSVNPYIEAQCNYIEGNKVNDDYYPGEKWFVYEVELIKSELKNVFPEYICDSEEGKADIYYRLFGDNSLWFGENSPDFYASAYGDGISG